MPFSEPWHTTALRNGSIALGVGIGVGLYQRHFTVVPLVTLLALWFTLGGHYVELLFRNRLGPLLASPGPRALVRLVYWFVGGSVLYALALVTRGIFTGQRAVSWPWWTGGVLFLAVELLIHLLMRVRQQPSFYDGRG